MGIGVIHLREREVEGEKDDVQIAGLVKWLRGEPSSSG